MKYPINDDLLIEYLITIQMMESARSSSVKHYASLDARREEIHDKILKSVNVKRDNVEFQAWFAAFIESLLLRKAS